MRRKSMSRRRSRRNFTRGAKRIHSINIQATPMRGGFRI